MKLEFVNHASLIFCHDNIRLISDPWLEGKVFDNGWSLLSPTKFSYQDFKSITHIWFSHEHPDHFFPPNIKAIPAEIRKNITVLYQFTNDKKVVEFCKNLGFKEVIELIPNQVLNLSENFSVINGLVGHDSWLHIKTDKYSLINTNDCVIGNAQLVKKIWEITGEVDLLLTQFSYAGKSGNTNEPEKRRQEVQDKYKQMQLQIDAFKPKYFVPIASFVWFSHEENFYMNDEPNKVDRVAEFILQAGLKPIVMYPSDQYSIGEEWDNRASINNYIEDYNKVNLSTTTKTVSTTVDVLKDSANKLIKQLKKEDRLALFVISFYPLRCYLSDLDKMVKFSVWSGLKEIPMVRNKANFEMTSEVLNYCLKFNWGFGATNVNGRFQLVKPKDETLFHYYVSVTDSLNHKDSTFKRICKKIGKKIKSIFKRQ